MPQKIELIISKDLTVLQLIKLFSEVNTDDDLELTLQIKCNGFIIADVYLLVVSFINNMRDNGKQVEISLIHEENCNAINYASRIDFFKQLGIAFEETITRHNVSGSLIPITNIKSNVWGLSEEILNIFKTDFKMSDTDVKELSFLIDEMICNTGIHSKCKSGSYLYCQKYKKANQLEIILVDSGLGIQKSLQKNDEFAKISNRDAVAKSIEFGITCGEGRGHGLYFASEFVRRNNGEMILISGDDRIVVKNQSVNNVTNHNWNGVYLRFLFNFDPKVSITTLMSEKQYQVN